MSDKKPCREGRFFSDWIEVFIDEPGDHTVRPIPPERMEQAKALRDRIRAAETAGVNVDECINVIFDEPGDHTVRPMSPKRIAQVKAERDRIRQIEAELKEKAKGNGQGT